MHAPHTTRMPRSSPMLYNDATESQWIGAVGIPERYFDGLGDCHAEILPCPSPLTYSPLGGILESEGGRNRPDHTRARSAPMTRGRSPQDSGLAMIRF